MRNILVSLIAGTTMLFAPVARATDTTAELLDAPWVREILRFQVTADGRLQAARDGSRTFVDVQDGSAWVLSEERDLSFRNFNPLLMTISTNESKESDVNYASVTKLLEAVRSQGGAAASPNEQAEELSKLIADKAALRSSVEMKARESGPTSQRRSAGTNPPDGPCGFYKSLHQWFRELHTALNKPVLDKGDPFVTWNRDSVTASGVKQVRAGMAETASALSATLDELAKIDQAIIRDYTVADDQLADPECSQIRASTLALAYEAARRINDVSSRRRQLINDLANLYESLRIYEDESRWREDNLKDLIFYKPSPDFTAVKMLTITARPRSFAINDERLEVTEGKAATATVRLRHYTMMVPELSGGIFSTDLKYPKYGTKQEGGQTVVASAGSVDAPTGASLMVNFVCRCWPSGPLYPAVQFGVMTSKQYPGFAVGAGFRLTRVASLAFTIGKLLTWYDDLEGLSVGQPISGTAELESHLKRKQAKPATYVGVQYNF